MTETQRATDEEVAYFAVDRRGSDGWEPFPSKMREMALDLRDARALAQSQAATIAELRAEVERVRGVSYGMDDMTDLVLEKWRQAAMDAAADGAEKTWVKPLALLSLLANVRGLFARAKAAESALATANAKIEKLKAALRTAIDAIASLNEDALGHNWTGDDEVPGGTESWPIRDELLHNLRAALQEDAPHG